MNYWTIESYNPTVKTAKSNINPGHPLLKELIDGLSSTNKYDHLRIILTRKKIRSFGQRFLMVTTSSFGLVRLLDLDVDDDHIYLIMQDICTGEISHVPFDVNDKTFQFLLVAWNDIISMTPQTNDNTDNDSSLLEFEY
jgi:hypothetical protein